MYLSQQDVANYERDGYIIVPDLFDAREVAAMIHEVETGGRVAGTSVDRADSSGRAAKLAIWFEIGDDIWGLASTCPRIVNNVRILLREEVSFYHGKVMLKEARSGGAWEWHQDYGYWYETFAYPSLISAFVALDDATIENGCLQVLKGSHHCGRLNHGQVGDQTGADTKRVEGLTTILEQVPVEMKAGSVLFFHSNLLHASAANNSEKHRRSFIMCYSALHNPRVGTPANCEPWPPCPVSADDAILRYAEG